MSTDQPLISVELEDDDTVVLKMIGEVDPSITRAFNLFWSSSQGIGKLTSTVRIPLTEFLDRMEWLRVPWRESGGRVEVSQEVIEATNAFKSGSAQFRNLKTLISSRYSNMETEVPNLKPSRVLTPRQHENILYLLDMQNGANFSVPGAGKTLTTLAVWQILVAQNKVGALLVICPRAAFESWESEVSESFMNLRSPERHSGGLFAAETQIGLINYEQLENPSRLSYLRSWMKANSAMLVLDEAHRVKGGGRSVRWAGVRSLAQMASRVDLLTGTPMPQGPSDLKSLFMASWPKLRRTDLDERHITALRRNTVFVRTTKGELNLPPLEIRTISEPPGKLQSDILDALSDRYLGSNFLSIGDSRNLAKRGKAVMTMLAAATNPALLSRLSLADYEMGLKWPPDAISSDATLSQLIENYSSHEIPWKIRYVTLRVKELADAGQKVLVWSNFVGSLATLKAALRSHNPALVHGSVASRDREEQLRKFRFDPSCSVLIANPQTLGEGVSLHQTCHHAIFVDRTYNAGLYLQAIDRIHRLGLEESQITTIELLQTTGTIDVRVGDRLETKVRRLASFLQDEHLVEASLPATDELSPDDILGLTDEDFIDIARLWGVPN